MAIVVVDLLKFHNFLNFYKCSFILVLKLYDLRRLLLHYHYYHQQNLDFNYHTLSLQGQYQENHSDYNASFYCGCTLSKLISEVFSSSLSTSCTHFIIIGNFDKFLV